MSKIRLVFICLTIIIITVLSTVLFSSCGDMKDFHKVDVTTTTKPVTEPVTYVYSDLEVFGTRMGMSIEEAQQALNVPVEVRFNDNGVVYFPINKTGLDFMKEDLEAAVYFIFDGDIRLSEIQYVSTAESGFVLEEALKKYDSLYGKHVVVEKTENVNYIWFKDGDYIIVTTFNSGQNAISFFSKAYFELTKPEDAKEFNEKIQEGA